MKVVKTMVMGDDVTFLLTKADELRQAANLMPDIASELRRMADECEALATKLSQARGRRSRP
jgi:hypothetical protein